MRKEVLKDLAGIIFFYLLIALSILVINARMEYLNNIGPNIVG